MEDARAFWLAEADAYLQACLAEMRSVRASEFAMRLRKSPASVAREFHSSVGFCVKDYFSARQLETAKRLLRTTRHSTAEIAALAGFGTPRTFYRAFKRSTGASPTEYRKEMSLEGPDFGT